MSFLYIFLRLGLIIGVAMVVIGAWPKPSNRRVSLPPPSDKCKRNGLESVP